MAVFDWAESRNSRVDSSARLREVRFGDGYTQRAPDGLNPFEDTWDLLFDQVDDAIGNSIETFFKARATTLGFEAFTWTPIWFVGAAIKVVCKRWTRTRVDLGISTLTATFERVYEP